MAQTSNRKRFRDLKGFTIIELLVAAAVTVVLAGLLLSMTSGVLASWSRISGALSANSQAQMIFDLITEDLQAAAHRQDGNVWLDVGMMNSTPTYLEETRGWRVADSSEPIFSEDRPWGSRVGIKPDSVVQEDDIAESRFGRGGVWLRFFSTPIADGETPRAISYQIGRRPVAGDHHPDHDDNETNPAEVRYMLFRSVLSAPRTFDRGFNLANYNYNETEAGWDGAYPPNELVVPATADAIAGNVIDFGVRLYAHDYEEDAIVLLFPADTGNPPSPSDTNVYFRANGGLGRQSLQGGLPPGKRRHYRDGGRLYEGEFPDVVDVFVRILTEEGARQIQNLESGRLPVSGTFYDQWWEIAIEHSRVFTRRIHVKARPF